MKKKKAVLIVGTQQKGFLIALARLLSEIVDVTMLAFDADIAANLQQHLPDIRVHIIDFNPYKPRGERNILSESLRIEQAYGENISMLCSQDRALGHAYLLNIDKYPMAKRAKWDNQKKYAQIISEIAYYEKMIEHEQPDIAISLVINHQLWLTTKKNEILYLAPSYIKFGTRLFWSDCPEYKSEKLVSTVQQYLQDRSGDESSPQICYEQEVGSKLNHSRVRYDYFDAIHKAAKTVLTDIYRIIRGRFKPDSYPLFGWVQSHFLRVLNYNYLKRIGKCPHDLKGRKIIYFPLHLEPEIALLNVSPEFNNSIEMISWISKSLPADAVLVLKEHPIAYAVRSRGYYERIARMPNVIWAAPVVQSWEWIKQSSIVTTITGTAAIEAIYFGKPVLSYGLHQIVNLLPSVRFASDYPSTKKSVQDLLDHKVTKEQIDRSRTALYKAQLEVSFAVPGFEEIYKSSKPEPEQAELAFQSLVALYGPLIAAGRG